jgi:hypothetical protein
VQYPPFLEIKMLNDNVWLLYIVLESGDEDIIYGAESAVQSVFDDWVDSITDSFSDNVLLVVEGYSDYEQNFPAKIAFQVKSVSILRIQKAQPLEE